MTASKPAPRLRILSALFLLLAAFGIEAPDAEAQTATSTTINICDRTAQVRDRILRELALTDCAAVPSERMGAIRNLSVPLYEEPTLKAGDFDNLPALERLWLHGPISPGRAAELASLPSGIFDNLPALDYLNLENS